MSFRRRSGRVFLLALLLPLFLGCSAGGHELLVDLRTDYRPGIEFGIVHIELVDSSGVTRQNTQLINRSDDGLGGFRVAELSGIPSGLTRFTVTLLDFSGAPIGSRVTVLTLDANAAVTVLVTANCGDVDCPGAGDPPTATQCVDAQCVPEQCTIESRDTCRDNTCETDLDCVSAIACTEASCRDGWCIRIPDDTSCRAGEYCQVTAGCTPLPPEVDGGVPDAGPCSEGAACDTGNECEEGRIDCTSGTPTCVPVGPEVAGTPCRPAVGECDTAEACDEMSLLCPADEVAPLGQPCAAGFCDGDGGCSDTCMPGAPCSTGSPCELGAINCSAGTPSCDPTGTPAAAGTLCRASVDVCDVDELCDGASTTCPADGFESTAVTCRAPSGACDREERCPGDGAGCPTDGVEGSGTTCRMAVGLCDRVESCTGSSPLCPADELLPMGTECRASTGTCDPAESCDGTSLVCPMDRTGVITLPAQALVFLDSAVAVPSGWTCVSCGAADPFWQRFVVGGGSYGMTGGTTSHTHTVTTAETAVGTGIIRVIGGGTRRGDASADGHMHPAASGTTTSANHLPPYRDLRVIRPNVPTSTLPAGAIVMLDTTTMPSADFSRFSAMDGRFVRGGNSSATGGAATHMDSATISLPNVASAWLTNQDNNNCIAAQINHRHDVVIAESEPNDPRHADVVFARVGATTSVPIGIVAMFQSSPGANWQVLSGSGGLLESDFLRGAPSANFGALGSNTHGLSRSITSGPPTVTEGFRGQPGCNHMPDAPRSSGSHTHSTPVTLSPVDHRPPYIQVIVAKLMSCS